MPSPVLFLVVAEVLAGEDALPPAAVLAVPGDRRGERVLEAVARSPAELAGGLRRVDGVAAVVPGAVLDVLDERLGLTEQRQHALDDLDVAALAGGAEVVDLPRLALLERGEEPAAVVLDVDPVADVEAVAVDRKRLVAERVRDHERYDLLRELVRAVVVRAARHDHVHPERVRIGERE